jgi:predicted DNA-binding transcriptional regulator AlpA
MRLNTPPLQLMRSRPPDQQLEEVKLLTAQQVAACLHISSKKVYDLPIPKIYLSERRVRWLERDVVAYIQDRRRTT